MSVAEYEQEPWQALHQARLVWDMEAERDKVNSIRQSPI